MNLLDNETTFADSRDPEACGQSIGFDGIYVCRLDCAPCCRVFQCPVMTISNSTWEGFQC